MCTWNVGVESDILTNLIIALTDPVDYDLLINVYTHAKELLDVHLPSEYLLACTK